MPNPLVGLIMGSSSDWETMAARGGNAGGAAGAVRAEGRVGAPHTRPAVRVRLHRRAARAARDHRRRRRRCASARNGRGEDRAARARRAGPHARAVRHGLAPVDRADARRRSRSALSRSAAPARSTPRCSRRRSSALPSRASSTPCASTGARAPRKSCRSRDPATGMNLGIIGGGQLGRMLALAAHPLGIRTRVLEPSASAPAAHVAGHVVAAVRRRGRARPVRGRARRRHVRVRERSRRFRAAASPSGSPVRPRPARARGLAGPRVREDRVRGLRHPDGRVRRRARRDRARRSARAARRARGREDDALGLRREGAGDRARRVRGRQRRGAQLGERPLIVEGFVRFDRELSILAARWLDGEIACWPLFENQHEGGILRRTVSSRAERQRAAAARGRDLRAPSARGARLRRRARARAVRRARRAARQRDGAARPQLRPLVTIEGAETSQFENHVRAVCGLPLGPVQAVGHSVMINLIGDPPPTREPCSPYPGAHVHVYGK